MDPPRGGSGRNGGRGGTARAGISVKMITGDHAATGAAIARRVGILAGDAGADAVITGVELDALDDAALASRVRRHRRFARVEPRHKMRDRRDPCRHWARSSR